MKQLAADPWEPWHLRNIRSAARVTGRVVSLTDYGAFVELEEGIEAPDPCLRDVLDPQCAAPVQGGVDRRGKSMRSCWISSPTLAAFRWPEARWPQSWDVIAKNDHRRDPSTQEARLRTLPPTSDLHRQSMKASARLVHISDLSWTKRIKHPSELYKKGDVVQAIVLDIEKDNERFSLGIKQLQEDPWKTVGARYRVGSEITGTINQRDGLRGFRGTGGGH